ncbi:DUF423 domain-containing protein [Pelagibacterium sediminicola]|uniref:DUF423 domain-containing protein n=1 Tax=Pelagibacterium sediminicola TaxID=2248761 RepID=UPI000E3103AD|nr:DUF423 domain-containing protein [Pelagibacterium sediminicola]
MIVIKSIALIVAGLLGASGVAAAAALSHAGADLLAPYALIALTHAPALLALGLVARTRILSVTMLILALGAILFCADLATRHFAGHGLFPMAAPIGGMLLIAGWLAVTLAGLAALRR